MTDKEWEIIEPLLPTKKKTRPRCGQSSKYSMVYFINSRMVAIGLTYKRDIPPYSTVFWHYQNWCHEGVLENIMTKLHGRVREQVKKTIELQQDVQNLIEQLMEHGLVEVSDS